MASSLPIYMYFNPSWSHAISAFSVALFIWYWDRTRLQRTAGQWALLGLAAGLMGNVYYPNAILLIFPALEVCSSLAREAPGFRPAILPIPELALHCGIFLAAFIARFCPLLSPGKIIYGSPFETGYPAIGTWNWTSPGFAQGFVFLRSRNVQLDSDPDPRRCGALFSHQARYLLGAGSLLTFLAYYYFIASYPDWDGLSSFGNRFFVSLTPIFILGLAALLSSLSSWLGKRRARIAVACPVLALLIVWNVGFIFQWGTHMVPARGEISWGTMVHNQFVEVPRRMTHTLETYFITAAK